MQEPGTAYEKVLSEARSLLPGFAKARRMDIRNRLFGDRLLRQEFMAVTREAAEKALPRDDRELLALAATPGVIYADISDDRHGDIRSAIVHVLASWIVRDMAEEAERAYEAQFGDDGPDRLVALANAALVAAKSTAVIRSPVAGARGRYDALESCFDSWRRGDAESLAEFAAEAEKAIADLAADERVSFRSAGRKFKELLYFATARPERFRFEPPAADLPRRH